MGVCLFGSCLKDNIEGSLFCLEHKGVRELRRKEEIAECIENGEFDCEDDVMCPHCGHEHDNGDYDPDIWEEGEHEFQCYNCNSKFEVETHIQITFSTKKIKSKGEC